MNEHRTWLATVLFLDIVGYSRVPVDRQMVVKQHFKSVVAPALAPLNAEECIQLDTGDGCAICYLGDPESMYPIATGLRQYFAAMDQGDAVYYQVRLGLNLGPVKITDGISGERNCVGAGINDAQRIMDFAGENQLLISRGYFELVDRMSSNYAEQLAFLGSRADKHDQLHDLYELVGASSTPKANPAAGFDIDPDKKAQISREFARYAGSAGAEQAVSEALGSVSSLSEFTARLLSQLSEDDAYHFREFARYYGFID